MAKVETLEAMSIVYRVDERLGTAFVVWQGTVTAEEFLAHVRRLTADADWPPDQRKHLTDLRSAIVDVSIDDQVLKTAADLFGKHPKTGKLRVAVVAADSYIKAGTFEKLIAPHQVLLFVFNSIRPACGWLGIDVADAEAILQALGRTGERWPLTGIRSAAPIVYIPQKTAIVKVLAETRRFDWKPLKKYCLGGLGNRGRSTNVTTHAVPLLPNSREFARVIIERHFRRHAPLEAFTVSRS
jgi:hypothetical protein